LPIFILVALALATGWPLPDAELTAPAARIFAGEGAQGLVTDGVALWRDWLPLNGPLLSGSIAGERALQCGLWLALILAIFGLARSLELPPWSATAVGSLVACHPLSAALYGDLAGRGWLVAALFMTLTAWAFRRAVSAEASPRDLVLIALGTLAASMGHPLGLLLPFLLGLFVLFAPAPLAGRLIHVRSLAACALPGLAVIAARWAMDLPSAIDLADHEALNGSDEVGPMTGLVLAGRTLARFLPAGHVLRRPCEIELADAGLASPFLWLGLLVLLVLPMIARRTSNPARALGLWWVWALVVAASQIAEPLPSALAPGMVALAWIGGALVLGSAATVPRAQGALVGAAVAMAVLTNPSARATLESEVLALEHRVSRCDAGPSATLRLAEHHLAGGEPRRALDLLDGVDGSAVAGLRIEIHLSRNAWGRVRKELRGLSGDDALLWRCRAGAAMSEMHGVASCAEARASLGDRSDLVAAHVKALTRDRRTQEAEALVRTQLETKPTDVILHGALASLLEGTGWMREAVEALEAWYALDAGGRQVAERLVRALERKAKGDLVAGRAEEARVTLERALVVAPHRHELRYHLAQALEDQGDAEAANRERKRAKDAGAEPPIGPLQMRGMPTLPSP
jgi:hypothetical protein